MQTLDLYTTEELAKIVRVTPDTVRFWRHLNKGPKYFKLGGGKRVFYRREDVEAWINEQYAEANPA